MTNQCLMTVTGGRELRDGIMKLPSYIRDECLQDATVAGALILVNRVKSIALEKHILLTGQLIRSYHIGGHLSQTPDFSPGESYSDIGGVIIGNDTYEVAVGTNLPYARRQEYGFEDTDARGRSYHYAARPHLRPAFDESMEAVREEMADTLRAKLKRYTLA